MEPSVRIYADPAQVAVWVADRVVERLQVAAEERRRVVFGLPTGSTPLPLYAELVRRHREEGLSFARATVFNLDEYWPLSPADPGSFAAFMRRHLVGQVDLPADAWLIPDGGCPAEEIEDHCEAYRRAIKEAGGIGLQVLGLGVNGHLGFNEPGSTAGSTTRLVELADSTKERFARTYPGVDVPQRGITMGMAEILAARRVVMVVTGAEKAAIAARAIEGEVSSDCPGSLLREHPATTWVLDREAAAELSAATVRRARSG